MSAIEHIRGSTWHGRKGDLKNAFRYSIDYLCLDIENAPPKKGFSSVIADGFLGFMEAIMAAL